MFMKLSIILLQAQEALPVLTTPQVIEESYFSILMKGGWILVPIIFLFFLSIYVIIERWLVIGKAGAKDDIWLSRVKELVGEKKVKKATEFCYNMKNASAKVIASGLVETNNGLEDVQEAMQVEARQEVNRLEQGLNYLGITASIAPMLGFLGTIFGVIKIFYNISVTNDLNIANISDGLYQKMICSGVGLFVGIIAYTGFYILNEKVDRIVAQMDKDSNEVVRAIKQQNKVKNDED